VASTARSTTGMMDCSDFTEILGGLAMLAELVLAPWELDVPVS